MKVTDLKFILISCVLLVAWGIHYSDALLGMENIWRRSDTFAHGYFIIPISLWLIYRDKGTLLVNSTEQSWLALMLLCGSCIAGLLAYAADINVVRQLSSVTSLICLIWLMLGNKLALHYKFPLLFLLFMVPMGENLIPWLQDITAWFTVFFLKLNGIPVYIDGLYIQIPTGMFEVAVACSGIRYLIASFAVGTLYAHLTYQKGYKQLIFILFALILPIVANGIRAYGIVAIAYYSDMKYATGVDHLIYGWLFFGIVIMLMFWVGGKFADPQQANNEKILQSSQKSKLLQPILALVFMVLSSFVINNLFLGKAPDTPDKLVKGVNISQSDWGITFTSSLAQSYIRQGNYEIFVAKYANQQDKGEMISFGNSLHDKTRWTVIYKNTFERDNVEFTNVLLRNINGNERSYVYLYKVGPFTTGSNAWAKIYQIIASLTGKSDYGYVYALSTVVTDNERTNEAAMAKVLEQMIVKVEATR